MTQHFDIHERRISTPDIAIRAPAACSARTAMEQAAIGLGPPAATTTVPARDVKRVAANTRRGSAQILALASPSSAKGARIGPTPGAYRAGLGLLIALVVAFGAAHAALAEGVEAFQYSTTGDGLGHGIGVLPESSRPTRSGRPVVERQAPLRGLDMHHDPVPSLHLECRALPPDGAEANPEDPGRPFTAYLTARKWREDRPARLRGDPEQWTATWPPADARKAMNGQPIGVPLAHWSEDFSFGIQFSAPVATIGEEALHPAYAILDAQPDNSEGTRWRFRVRPAWSADARIRVGVDHSPGFAPACTPSNVCGAAGEPLGAAVIVNVPSRPPSRWPARTRCTAGRRAARPPARPPVPAWRG